MVARFPKSVTPGDPIPTGSEAWNAILGAAYEFRQAGRPDAPPARGGHGGVVWALALNSTGANLPPYKAAAVTAAGGIDVSGSDPDDDGGPPWQRRPVLTLGEPAAVTDWVCVTLEAIPDGEFGRVAVSGVVLCDVDSASGATWAAPQVGDTTLLGGSTGTVRVLHVPSGGGSQRRCVVYLHERPEPAAPTISTLTNSPSASVTLTGNNLWTTVATLTLTAGTWAVWYAMTAVINGGQVVGDGIQSRMLTASTEYGYAFVTSTPVVNALQTGTASGMGIFTVTGSQTLVLQAQRSYGLTPPSSSYVLGGSNANTGLMALKLS